MNKMLASYAAVFLVMLSLDAIWLGFIAKPLYQQAIGHLMSEAPRIEIALLFYLIYALGLTVFGVWPQAQVAGLLSALGMGAAFGFFCYATYDLTNLATLKNWPLGISLIDLAWGTVVSGISAMAGKLALDAVKT
jgi:uncharacterized membrane protein